MRPRLGLTTSANRIEHLRRPVEAAGLEPVPLPCIEATPLDRSVLDTARGMAETCDWLVVTSSRTIEALWPAGGMPDVPTAAVGETTAAAVESAGGSVQVVGDGGASQLFRTLAGFVDAEFVYFPHGASADLTSVRDLGDVAARLETTAVYETRPISPADDEVDAVVFGSPSAVEGWFGTRGADGLAVGAVGRTTALALEERGVREVLMPRRPSFPLLVSLLAAHLGVRSVT